MLQITALNTTENTWPYFQTTGAEAPQLNEFPLISVTIPSFNQGQYLETAIRSVLMQNYPNIELFVMDGGSVDGSVEIIQHYAPWLRGWISARDAGQSDAINRGWSRSHGEIIAYLNSDDFYLPGAFERVAECALSHPNAPLICGGICYVHANGTREREKAAFCAQTVGTDLSTSPISDWFLPQQSCFFSRFALDQVGFFLNKDLHYVMDRELIYRLSRLGRVEIIPQVLAADRKHPSSKRQVARLKMAVEDRNVLLACYWGTSKDHQRRAKVARERLAQGYWQYARDIASWPKRTAYECAAILLHPGYLQRWRWGRRIFTHFRQIRNRLLAE